MGELKERIQADLRDAMKARDQLRVDTLRSALSGFIYKRTESGKDLSEQEELEVVRKQVKQRRDSAQEFRKAARVELAEKEERERDVLLEYLPAQKSADEIRAVVRAVMEQLPAQGRNHGTLMKAVMPQLKDSADGALVRQIVLEELQV